MSTGKDRDVHVTEKEQLSRATDAQLDDTLKHRLLEEHDYEDLVMPGPMSAAVLDRVKEFRFRGDVVVASYPKTGTSWLQEMTWLVLNDGDTETANQSDNFRRVAFLESRNIKTGAKTMDTVESQARPAFMKTHLPERFFRQQLENDEVKFIVIVRNPKDTFVSLYHFYTSSRLLGNFTGHWDDFFALVKAKRTFYGDYFMWYKKWWKHQDNPKVLFVKYEDMHENLPREIRRIAVFLGKVFTDDAIERIALHGEFSSMRDNKMTNYSNFPEYWLNQAISPFMRAGSVGDWTKYFSEEQSAFVDHLYSTELEAHGLRLRFQ